MSQTPTTGNPVLREEWLVLATEYFRQEFAKVGVHLPFVRLSVGFPLGIRGPKPTLPGQAPVRAKAGSQCWPPATTEDGLAQIFINPMISDSDEVLTSLVHELIHVESGDTSHKKGGVFDLRKGHVGLVGYASNPKPTKYLQDLFTDILLAIGPYENIHAKPILQPNSGPSKNSFQKKVFCRCCGDLSRRTQKHIDKLKEAIALGAPSCVKCFVGHPDCTGLCKQQQPQLQGGGGSPPPQDEFDITPNPNQSPSSGSGQSGSGESDSEEEGDGEGDGEEDDGEGGDDESQSPGGSGAGYGDGEEKGEKKAHIQMVAGGGGGTFKPSVHRKDLCPFGSGCPQCEGDY